MLTAMGTLILCRPRYLPRRAGRGIFRVITETGFVNACSFDLAQCRRALRRIKTFSGRYHLCAHAADHYAMLIMGVSIAFSS
ncbi:MAG: hypothetical protein ACLQFW_16620 [Xanthobacteraceae bacterium]